jgi:cobalt-precorrin 5A hydrolase
MGLAKAVTSVAGIGCRRGVTAGEVRAAVAAALRCHGVDRLTALATAEAKRSEEGISRAAREMGLPLVHVGEEALAQAAGRAMTRSARVESLLGIPSLAETAALAAAGPASRLCGQRLALGAVTCAIAMAGEP